MVYSGDQDSLIPLTGTESLLKGLAKDIGLDISDHYRSWFDGPQVAGWTETYGDILTFATIRGAGHAAPTSQPGKVLPAVSEFHRSKTTSKKCNRSILVYLVG